MSARQPWERMPGEGAKAYAAFERFLEQEPSKRTLVEAARRTYGEAGVTRAGAVVGRIREWVREWDWAARAQAWDDHQAADRRRMEAEQMRAMFERHLLQAETLQTAAFQPGLELVRRLQDNPRLLQEMKIDELVRLARTAGYIWTNIARFERLARGAAEGRLELTGPDGEPLAGEMSPEEAISVLAPLLGVEEEDVVDELAKRRKAFRERKRAEEAGEGTGT